MNGRVSGTIYRGDAVYYTFQRLSTGANYLQRQADKGKDLKTFRVEFTRDGAGKEMTGTAFVSWASKLKTEAPTAKGKKVAAAKKAPAKKAAKPRTRKAAPAADPAEESSES